MGPVMVASFAPRAPIHSNIVTYSFGKWRFIFLEARQIANILPAKIFPSSNPFQHKISVKHQQHKTKS